MLPIHSLLRGGGMLYAPPLTHIVFSDIKRFLCAQSNFSFSFEGAKPEEDLKN